MAEVSTGGGEEKKGKPKKQVLRVDFTPMVDMNMLLITFFMFCTSLSKPQVMNIVMPAKDKDIKEDQKNLTKSSLTITLLLGKDNKVYYYAGAFDKKMYSDYSSLKETNYDPNGLRQILLDRNRAAVQKVAALRIKKAKKEITDEAFAAEVSKIKKDDNAQVVVIKPTINSSYENLVNTLDEMQICSIGKYAIVDPSDGDNYLIENLESKGAFGATKPKK